MSAATRAAVATALAAGIALLATACGGASQSGPSTTSSQSGHATGALAFARCMRAHGVPTFPDPDSQGSFPPFHTGVSKEVSSTADRACKHLASSGGVATPKQEEQKLVFGVHVARCLRAHGYPSFPDPTRLGSQSLPAGIDTNSPQFQSAETACEHEAQRALGLP